MVQLPSVLESPGVTANPVLPVWSSCCSFMEIGLKSLMETVLSQFLRVRFLKAQKLCFLCHRPLGCVIFQEETNTTLGSCTVTI